MTTAQINWARIEKLNNAARNTLKFRGYSDEFQALRDCGTFNAASAHLTEMAWAEQEAYAYVALKAANDDEWESANDRYLAIADANRCVSVAIASALTLLNHANPNTLPDAVSDFEFHLSRAEFLLNSIVEVIVNGTP